MKLNAQTSTLPCFTMDVSEPYEGKIGYRCIDIKIDINTFIGDQEVQIEDNFGNSASCQKECSFTWCYPKPPKNTNYIVEIECSAGVHEEGPYCRQHEGCIVVIGPG